jgi:catechol 2,3-dioxygenase-like lactoylglutathione lyase family enzyme
VSARINHVSINARDLQESVDFYVDLLGAELIPTPNFGLPVQWLALGRTQLPCSSVTSSRPARLRSRA